MSIYVYSATSKVFPVLIEGVIHQAVYYKYTHNQSLEGDCSWFDNAKGLFSKIKYWAERGLNKAKSNNITYVIVGDDDYPDDSRTVFKVNNVDDLVTFIWDNDPNKDHQRLGEFKKSKFGRRVVYSPFTEMK